MRPSFWLVWRDAFLILRFKCLSLSLRNSRSWLFWIPNLVVRYGKSSRASCGHRRECLCYKGFSSAVVTALANFSTLGGV